MMKKFACTRGTRLEQVPFNWCKLSIEDDQKDDDQSEEDRNSGEDTKPRPKLPPWCPDGLDPNATPSTPSKAPHRTTSPKPATTQRVSTRQPAAPTTSPILTKLLSTTKQRTLTTTKRFLTTLRTTMCTTKTITATKTVTKTVPTRLVPTPMPTTTTKVPTTTVKVPTTTTKVPTTIVKVPTTIVKVPTTTVKVPTTTAAKTTVKRTTTPLRTTTVPTTTKRKCRTMCPLILEPVCGTDGITYTSACVLEAEACYMNDKTLMVAYEGPCITTLQPVQPH